MALRAVVVGGGIGGTAAALALARAGIDVRVYEQAGQLTEVGAGVSLAPNGLRTLEWLGVGDEVERLGARHASTQLTLSNGQAARHEPHQFAQAGRNVGIHRADLLALLVAQLPPGTVRTGHRCAISGPGGSGFRWGMYDRAPLPRWSHRRLTLLGDAAHPMLPHLGQGVNQALEDAVALATLLAAGSDPAGVPRALAAYEKLRRDRTARVQFGSRRNGAGYDSSGSRLADRRWIYGYDAQAEATALTAAAGPAAR